MYTSRIDGDITTYDIRMVYPNAGTYIEPAAGHTFEHLFATYARNSRFADSIIYCGPMGRQTGFYFLVRDMKPADAIALVQESMAFIAAYEGEIPREPHRMRQLSAARPCGRKEACFFHDPRARGLERRKFNL